MTNNIKLKDVVEALKVLYKYLEFKKVLDQLFPALSQNTIKLSSINIYNFEIFYLYKALPENLILRYENRLYQRLLPKHHLRFWQ